MGDTMLENILKKYNGGKILDVGTGRGELIEELKNSFNSYENIIGIDSSKKAIEFCRENNKDNNVIFMEMDGSNMTFAEGTFDTVCISNTLHHLNKNQMNKILNEMKKVIKKDGLFIICEMYKDNQSPSQMSHVYLHHLCAEMDRLNGITHNDTFNRDEIIKIAKEINIEIIEAFDYADEEIVEKEEITPILLSLEKRLNSFEDSSSHSALKSKLEKVKDNLDKYSFSGATELIIIGRKK